MLVRCTTYKEVTDLKDWDKEEEHSACPKCGIDVHDSVLNLIKEDSIMKYAKDYEAGY